MVSFLANPLLRLHLSFIPFVAFAGYGADFVEFVNACLVKDPEQRPTLRTLTKLACIKKAGKTSELAETER